MLPGGGNVLTPPALRRLDGWMEEEERGEHLLSQGDPEETQSCWRNSRKFALQCAKSMCLIMDRNPVSG